MNSATASLVIRRKSHFTYAVRNFSIYIDGSKQDSLANGSQKTLILEPGQHTIYLTVDYYKSNPLEITLRPGESVALVCGLQTGGANPLTAWLSKDTYLNLDFDQPIETPPADAIQVGDNSSSQNIVIGKNIQVEQAPAPAKQEPPAKEKPPGAAEPDLAAPTCPHCGKTLRPNARFCGSCGGEIAVAPVPPKPASGPAEMFTILFLAADPTNAARLRAGEEAREIGEKLQMSRHRQNFQLHQRLSVRPEDFSQALLDLGPQIVHFSGHGSASGMLCFEDQTGQALAVPPEALAALFEQFADQVQCVILNACYSEIQAHAIAQSISYVIGMPQAISDRAAVAFAIGFYQALGAGRPIPAAFKLGLAQARLHGATAELGPVLVQKSILAGAGQEKPPAS